MRTVILDKDPTHEELERNIREHLDLRLRFAEAVSKAKGIPLADAMRDHTDLHVRLTRKRFRQSEHPDQIWQEFVGGISALSHDALLDRIIQFFKSDSITQHEGDPFYPFRYGYSERDHAIELHFGTMRPRAGNPDATEYPYRVKEMRKKLREMFMEIKHKYPDPDNSLTVHVASWLLNREISQRFFPRAFTERLQIRKGVFTGGGAWGQFRDKSGGVNEVIKARFLSNLKHLNPDHLEDAFPYKTLMASAPIEDFYKEYGIS